jgi:hypothetical protein
LAFFGRFSKWKWLYNDLGSTFFLLVDFAIRTIYRAFFGLTGRALALIEGPQYCSHGRKLVNKSSRLSKNIEMDVIFKVTGYSYEDNSKMETWTYRNL